jgi:DNA polymerase-3 subunit gamma/tau
MTYQVLARKWRPRRFEDLIGQRHVVQALANALDSGRLHHAYLFCGTRGVGKTTVARILARALNCEAGVSSKPCGACDACREIDEGRFVDLIEVDAASRTKVDQTRELLDNVQYAPTRGRYKVYLIDEVHMFSDSSFNALLKTLEEPPPHVKFLLATTSPKKLPVTILSRCLQFNLRTIAVPDIESQLKMIVQAEGVDSDEASLNLLATAADGSLRDALSLLDQGIAYTAGRLNEAQLAVMLGTVGREQILSLIEAVADRDGARLVTQVRTMAETGCDFMLALGELTATLGRIAVRQMVPAEEPEAGHPRTTQFERRITELAARISAEDCQLYYQIALLGRRDLPLAPDPVSGMEVLLLRMLAFQPSSAWRGNASEPAAARGLSEGPARADSKAQAVVSSGRVVAQEWARIVEALDVNGPTRELAANCVVQSSSEDEICLTLASTHALLRNDRTESRLREALSAYAGRQLKVVLQVEQGQTGETPVQARTRQQRERDEAAARTIRDDPNVQALCERFDATIERTEAR